MIDVPARMRDLLAASREVLTANALGNGALVAVNTDLPQATKGTSNYRFVWPRDAAFMIYAGHLLELPLGEPFSRWLLERAESFHERGLFCRRYATHGPDSSAPIEEYQPDQAGALLWALTSTIDKPSPEVQQVIEITANALCRSWHFDRFTVSTYDLWEQFLNSELHGSFVYTLAACSYGLHAAARHHEYPDRGRWLEVSQQMRQQLLDFGQASFTRLNHFADGRIDASLLGLVWPFRCTENLDALKQTINHIHDDLWVQNGMMRFQEDIYDGRVKQSLDLQAGAGRWPLLSCWYATVLHELDETERARQIFEELVAGLPERWIPEQLFSDGRQGVSPLGWSHAMYVIAYYRLGYNQ